jgi:fatty acyl-CoA reductase
VKPKQLEKMSNQLLKTFPNSHAVTKALLEHALTTNKEVCAVSTLYLFQSSIDKFAAQNVPLVIVRPSTIGATLKEPFPGWVDSLSIAGTLFIYTGLGVIKFFPGDPQLAADIVPCDLVANVILASVVQYASNSDSLRKSQDIPIIHAATSTANPVKYATAVPLWSCSSRTYSVVT